MLRRVTIEGIKFPRLYIAETQDDVELAMKNGVPFVKWKHGQEKLVKLLLRPTLEKMFPGINWNKVLGRKRPVDSKVYIVPGYESDGVGNVADYDKDEMLEAQTMYDQIVDDVDHDKAVPDEDGVYSRHVDIADWRRDCIADNSEFGYVATGDWLPLEDYVGDLSSYVDIDALQKLGMLPKFVGDVVDCIKANLSNNMRWTEGYTKKLGYPLGKFVMKRELPNLVIIDVSWSIPDGIAATMLTLADTLRSQCNADLIITSARSGFYPAGSELPSPQTLRDYYGRSNESAEFRAILQKYVAGREFGYVISFGDFDNPGSIADIDMSGTKVHEVLHYHTCYKGWTGYARWVHEICPDVVEHEDTSWCKVLNKRYSIA